MQDAIADSPCEGATVVDPADIPSIVTTDPARSLLRWSVCSGPADAKGRDEDCSVVFKYGMKRDFNAWLASLGDRAPVKTLEELRAWNRSHEAAGTLKYGQSQLDISDEMDLEADRARYQRPTATKDVTLAGRDGIDAALTANQLDALAVSRQRRRRHCGQARLPDGDRSVWNGAEHFGACRLRRKTGTLRRQLYGHRVQRRAADRAGVRVRTGDPAPRPSSSGLKPLEQR